MSLQEEINMAEHNTPNQEKATALIHADHDHEHQHDHIPHNDNHLNNNMITKVFSGMFFSNHIKILT